MSKYTVDDSVKSAAENVERQYYVKLSPAVVLLPTVHDLYGDKYVGNKCAIKLSRRI